jgi:hypothetical protein
MPAMDASEPAQPQLREGDPAQPTSSTQRSEHVHIDMLVQCIARTVQECLESVHP